MSIKKYFRNYPFVQKLKRRTDSILNDLGYQKKDSRPFVSLQELDLDLKLPSLLGMNNGIQVLVEVKQERLRDVPPITPPMPVNPFYLIALEYIRTGNRNKATAIADKWYGLATPPHAGAVLDIYSPILEQMEPLMARLPWEGTPGPGEKTVRLRRAKRQAEQYNLNLTGEDGDYAMGPLSSGKVAFETARICDLVDSVRTHGYHVEFPEDHINCKYIMVDESDTTKWCMMIKSGTHRLAVLMALGWEKFPVLIEKSHFIKKSGVDTWSAVKNGVVSAGDAVRVFDRVLNNKLPKSLDVLNRTFTDQH